MMANIAKRRPRAPGLLHAATRTILGAALLRGALRAIARRNLLVATALGLGSAVVAARSSRRGSPKRLAAATSQPRR